MKARLYQIIGGRSAKTEFEENQLISGMKAKGFALRGFNHNASQRAELQDQPKFQGVLGPMWDGDGLRYEDPATYEALSSDDYNTPTLKP